MTIVGIDLGTTYSAIGYMSNDGPRLISNSLGRLLTPSVVGIDRDGSVLVGEAAKELHVVAPQRCAAVFKRYMGSTRTVDLDGKKYDASMLSSLVLRSLLADAAAHFGEPVSRAVITVPAYFNDNQRRATLLAGRMAGLSVDRIINEPTAAAIAYGINDSEAEKLIAVLDLGGGTFDVSVVEFYEGVIEVRASSGECFLGGEDFTRVIASRVLEQQGYVYERAEVEAPLLVARTMQLCEVAKQQLSRGIDAQIRVADDQGKFSGTSPSLTVTPQQFRKWTESILSQIDRPIRLALGDAKLSIRDVDEVILVGGATRMPALRERVARYFGKEPRCQLNPDEAIALGASVQAGLIGNNRALEDLVVTDVSPFTLGFEVAKSFGREVRDGYFSPLINRNTPIPVSESTVVSTIHSNQTQTAIHVYQGESRRTEENLLLGELLVERIPKGPPGAKVEIRFTYDLNGVLEVEATVQETKETFSLVIAQHAGSLSEAEVAAAVAAMQTLKIHPRDESVNRLLVRRAERVFQELCLTDRQKLEELIDGFEQSLEMKDPTAIEKFALAINMFLEHFDHGSDELA